MAKAALELIRVEWAEAYDDLSPTYETPFTVQSWNALDDYLKRVYDSREREGGYSKVKVHIEWVNGDYLTDRIDVGDNMGDYQPARDAPIGLYLQGEGVGHTARGTMYGSSFQYETKDGEPRGIVTDTTRDNVAWTDSESKDAAGVEEYHKEQNKIDRGELLDRFIDLKAEISQALDDFYNELKDDY